MHMIDEIEFEVEYVDGEWGKLMRMSFRVTIPTLSHSFHNTVVEVLDNVKSIEQS